MYACIAVTRRSKVGRRVVLIGWYGPVTEREAVERVRYDLLRKHLDQGRPHRIIGVEEIDLKQSILLPGKLVSFPTAYKPGTLLEFIETITKEYNATFAKGNPIISD